MTKEELKQEAEELIQRFEMANSMNYYMSLTPDRKQIGEMLVMIAEPREKRIEELEKENAELKEVHESDKRSLRLIAEKGAELEKKISILLSCNNCPDNKGGLLCQKEYEDKCLAQKIQYIKELKEENAELKNQIEKMKCCANCKYQCQFLYQIADCLKNGLFKWEILEASLND